MLRELTTTLVKVFDKHTESVLSGAFGIGGTILGLLGGHFLEQWRSRGKVAITPVEMRPIFLGKQERNELGEMIKRPIKLPEDVETVVINFQLRLFNTFPVEKTFELVGFDVFRHKVFQWSKTKPLLSTKHIRLTTGTETQLKGSAPFNISAGSFIRLNIQAECFSREIADRVYRLTKWRAIRLTFLVSPGKSVRVWHTFSYKDVYGVLFASFPRPTTHEEPHA